MNREHQLFSLPFPPPRDMPEPRLTLEAALGDNGLAAVKTIEANGQIVFHSVGDTGNTRSPDPQNYDDLDYGYLRVIADEQQLRIEYHPASDGSAAKTPDDFVTVDFASRKRFHFTGAKTAWPVSVRAG